MKTQLILKIAVVAMAAFGAYAFSGNSASNLQPYIIKVEEVCTDILAECSDSGNFACKITTQNSPDIFGLDCKRIIMHATDDAVLWQSINP